MTANVSFGTTGDSVRPEYRLTELMQNEMQIDAIHPVTLRLFIIAHWDEVSRLAHKIHASGPKQQD